MPEPISHTAAGAALAAPVAAVASGIFGIEFVSIGWAFVGGVLSLIWMPRFEYWWSALISVASSTILGATIGQWSAEPVLLTVNHFAAWLAPWATTAQPTATCALAFTVALFAQKAMPGLLHRVRILSEGKQA